MKYFVNDSEIDSLTSEIDRELDNLRSIGDFTPQVADELAREFLPDSLRQVIDRELLAGRIEDTLAIESIVVNPRITTSVLEGNALNDVDGRTTLAILNVNAANQFIENEAREGSRISTRIISEINRLIEVGSGESENPGSFRTKQVGITGAPVQPPHWGEVKDRLEEAISIAESGLGHPLVSAAYIHWAVSAIHPFENGNGRTARLCQDYFLIRTGYLPVGIPKAKRVEYYRALEEADQGDGKDLILLVGNALLTSLHRAVEIATRPVKQEQRMARLVSLLQTRGHQTEIKEYEVWNSKAALFASEVKRRLELFNTRQDVLQFQIYEEQIPVFESWKRMVDAGRSDKTHLVRVQVEINGKFAFKFLWYAKRHRMDWVRGQTRHLRNEIGFFLDIRDDKQESWSFQALQDEQYIAIREIVPTADGWLYFLDPKVLGETREGIVLQVYSPNWEMEFSQTLGEVLDQFEDSIFAKLGLSV